MSSRHRAPGGSSERTPREASARRRRRVFRLRTIRARLAAILAVPTALLVVLTSYAVLDQVGRTREAAAAVKSVDLVLSAQELIHSLQKERGLTSGLLGGDSAFRSQVDQQRRDSDAARTALDQVAAAVGGDGAAVRTALGRLGELDSVRGAVDAGRLARPDMLAFYTSAINALSDASAADPAAERQDAGLRQGLESLRLLGDAKEATALERGTLNGVFAAGAFGPGDYVAFTEIRARKVAARAEFARIAAPTRLADLRAAEQSQPALLAASYEDQALAGASGKALHVEPEQWWSAMTSLVDELHTVQHAVGDDVRARAHQDEAAAQRLLIGYAAAAGVAVLVAFVLWLYTIGSIIRPLRMLTSEARTAARQRLPDAVAAIQDAEDPHSVELAPGRSAAAGRRDEFAEVASALDDLQATAVRLAVEQAVMRRSTSESLANLARRNQNLVRRQLGFITTLEEKETDPDQLADLFELDHLATRMRRNAESLLVLVGDHSPRRWSGGIDVTDALRAAFADVEDYRRVVLRRADEARVRGTAAGDISHLLAELVENALTFSPPDREVEVQGRRSGGEYHIAVVDQGIGMTAEATARANARLRGEQNFLAAPTRELGHFVVGRLAHRLGARVWLHESPLTGVTARVVLPAGLLVEAERAVPGAGGMAAVPAPYPMPALSEAAIPPPRSPAAAVALGAGAGLGVEVGSRVGEAVQIADFVDIPPPSSTTPGVTANGLVKRSRSGAPRPRPHERPAPAEPTRPAAPAGPDRSPAEVRSMLTAFRSGVHGTARPPAEKPN